MPVVEGGLGIDGVNAVEDFDSELEVGEGEDGRTISFDFKRRMPLVSGTGGSECVGLKGLQLGLRVIRASGLMRSHQNKQLFGKYIIDCTGSARPLYSEKEQ